MLGRLQQADVTVLSQKKILASTHAVEYLTYIMISKLKRIAVVSVGAFSMSPVFAQESPAPAPGPSSGEAKYDEEADQAKMANLDKVPGFGGVAFGAEFPAKGFQLEQDRGGLKLYKKTGEKLLVGPALLEAVIYHVYEGKFYGVAFHTNDGQDSLALKNILINAFGTGENSTDEGPSTVWIAKKNGALFDLNQSNGDGSVFLFDIKIHDAVLADQAAAEKAAAQQLIQGKP
jgi:hypothetical protein